MLNRNEIQKGDNMAEPNDYCFCKRINNSIKWGSADQTGYRGNAWVQVGECTACGQEFEKQGTRGEENSIIKVSK